MNPQHMVQLLEKNAAALTDAKDTIQSQQDKIAELETRIDCMKLAQDLHTRGIFVDQPADTLASTLEKMSEEKRETYKAAMDLHGDNLYRDYATTGGEEGGGASLYTGSPSDRSKQALDSYVAFGR